MSSSTPSWVNGTMAEAVEMLAKRASVARLLRQAEKSSGWFSQPEAAPDPMVLDMLKVLADKHRNDVSDAAGSGGRLVGALGGSALGAARGMDTAGSLAKYFKAGPSRSKLAPMLGLGLGTLTGGTVGGMAGGYLGKLARPGAQKKADYSEAFNNGLSALNRQIELNPALASTLGGAAIGAGVGGLSSFGKRPEERNTAGSALTGALAGGAVGGGGYLASRLVPELKTQMLGEEGNPLAFMNAGKVRELNPDAVKHSPQLINEVEQLKSRSPISQAAGKSWDTVKNYASNHPILSMIGAADLGSSAIGTAAGEVSGLPGMRSNVFREGLKRMKAELGEKDFAKTWGTAANMTDQDIEQFLHQAREAGRHGRAQWYTGHSAPKGGTPGTPTYANISTDQIKRIYDMGGGKWRMGGLQSLQDLGDFFANKGKASPAGSPGSRTRWTGMSGTPSPGDNVSINDLLRRITTAKGPTSLAGKVLPRAALYAGIPALEAYAGTAMQESSNNKRLNALMQQLSSPAQGQ